VQLLAICRRRTESFSEAEFAALLDAEAEGVRVLYAAGIARNAWTREDVLGACLMLEVESVAHAEQVMAPLPLNVAGMLEIQFIPLRGYRGFGPRSIQS
jgi:hypothetical protein